MTALEETWELLTKTNDYTAVPDTPHQLAALTAINGMMFRAMSIGGLNGQVAIIPLDESSEERGRLTAKAPEMARMLLAAWHDECQRAQLESLLKDLRLLPR